MRGSAACIAVPPKWMAGFAPRRACSRAIRFARARPELRWDSTRARSYGDVAEMLAAEGRRPDPVDAVAIMSPNDTHYPFAAAALDAGLDVVCDKPVTHDFAQACDLVARTRQHGRIFAIAHGYSAYPMTRYARHLVSGRRARDGPAGAGGVHPERSRHANRGRPAEQSSALVVRSRTERAGARDERDRLPRAASCVLRFGVVRGARRRRRRRAVAGPQGRRLRLGADRIRWRRARHDDRHPGGGRRRKRHPAARLRREGNARLVAPRAELSEARDARASRCARSAAATPFCRRRSSPPDARRAAIPRDCAKPSPTSMRKSRRNEWRERWEIPFPTFAIRESRTAPTPWRSSRPVWRRRRGAPGSTSRRSRCRDARRAAPTGSRAFLGRRRWISL